MPIIIIDHDKVTIEGVAVPRPVHISPSQWLMFWEAVVNGPEKDD